MIRPADVEETDAVRQGLDAIDPGLADALLAGDLLLVAEQEEALVVTATSPAVLGLPGQLLEGADHAGLRIGTLEDGRFALDLQGALLAASLTRSQTVRVSEKATRVWLYGRDIIGSSIEWYDGRLRTGATCIVCNPRGEGIGLGAVVGPLRGPRTAVQHILDLGTYLRDQDTA